VGFFSGATVVGAAGQSGEMVARPFHAADLPQPPKRSLAAAITIIVCRLGAFLAR
jgi:hypothetical protein